eukprot:5703118-Alexandrium_andersonii.AAC.1
MVEAPQSERLEPLHGGASEASRGRLHCIAASGRIGRLGRLHCTAASGELADLAAFIAQRLQ